jgi:branched-subunit amino acid ABC-type transport system permease component
VTKVSIVVPAVGFGIVTSSILALAAVGFTLQAGITNVVNLAYGSMLTTAAFVAYIGQNIFHLPLWLAAVAAALVLGIVAVLIHRLFVLPFILHGVSNFNLMLVTFAVGIILEYILVAFYGETFYSLNGVDLTPVNVGELVFTRTEIGIIALSIAVMLVIHMLLRYTKLGKAMRAMSDDKVLARNCGIDVDRVTDITWFLSGILCGFAGVALAMDASSFNEIVGSNFLLVVVAAAVLGGSGKPYGAMAGALIIGLSMEISTTWVNSDYKQVIALLFLVLTILFRPQGLLNGRRVTAR